MEQVPALPRATVETKHQPRVRLEGGEALRRDDLAGDLASVQSL